MAVQRASTDPNVNVPQADDATVREIRCEQAQAAVTDANQAVVSGISGPAAPPDAAAIGNGFQFTPEQIENLIGHAQRLIEQCQTDRADIERIMLVKPPSPDEAGSVLHAGTLSKWGKNLMRLSEADLAFLNSWLTTLTQAKQRYMETEHMSAEQWAKLAKGMGG